MSSEAGESQLASQLGFKHFSVKVSGRFYKSLHDETPFAEKSNLLSSFPVYDRRGNYEYDLELPTDTRFHNGAYATMSNEVAGRGSLTPYLESTCISCRAQSASSCFVSSEGTVFPCCWTYSASKHTDIFGMKLNENRQVDALLARLGGPSSLDARNTPITDIVSGPLFSAIADSWQKSTLRSGKLKTCARMCGKSIAQFEDQFLDPALAPGRKPCSTEANHDR